MDERFLTKLAQINHWETGQRTGQILVTLPPFKVIVGQRMLKNVLSLSYLLKGLIDKG